MPTFPAAGGLAIQPYMVDVNTLWVGLARAGGVEAAAGLPGFGAVPPRTVD